MIKPIILTSLLVCLTSVMATTPPDATSAGVILRELKQADLLVRQRTPSEVVTPEREHQGAQLLLKIAEQKNPQALRKALHAFRGKGGLTDVLLLKVLALMFVPPNTSPRSLAPKSFLDQFYIVRGELLTRYIPDATLGKSPNTEKLFDLYLKYSPRRDLKWLKSQVK